MTNVTFNIPNISCGHCVNTIKMEIADLEGVQSVDASADTKMATVSFDQPATEESIKALLAEINYPAVS